MTRVLHASSVSEALAKGLRLLNEPHQLREETRNGPVISATGPVVTQSMSPMRRVLFSPKRHANPFFHLFESFWMLEGRNDLPWLMQFNRQMVAYSDDGGKTQPGAYGFRWREYFGYDQLELIVAELTARPNSRRAVLSMWDAGGDRDNSVLVGMGDLVAAAHGSKDVPCNTQCYFRIRQEELEPALDMGVTNRSNDALWGAHGANAVHFSVLQEYLAARLGVGMGRMTQFSYNYHIYPDALRCDMLELAQDCDECDYYVTRQVNTTPIFNGPDDAALFMRELPVFTQWAAPMDRPITSTRGPVPRFQHKFLKDVAAPMLRCWDQHKKVDYHYALQLIHEIADGDWQVASLGWLRTMRDNHAAKEG